MLSVKQGSIKYHFLSLWYDSTWDRTQVSWAIGEYSNHYANVEGIELLNQERNQEKKQEILRNLLEAENRKRQENRDERKSKKKKNLTTRKLIQTELCSRYLIKVITTWKSTL